MEYGGLDVSSTIYSCGRGYARSGFVAQP